jgi:hypothetical protein
MNANKDDQAAHELPANEEAAEPVNELRRGGSLLACNEHDAVWDTVDGSHGLEYGGSCCADRCHGRVTFLYAGAQPTQRPPHAASR